MKVREIKADFIRCDYRNIFNITQYNKNIPIKINLYEDGIPFNIPSGAIVKVEVSVRSSKENVAVIITNATVGNNYIIIKNPREMCLCNGDGALQVRIEKGDYVYITPQVKFKVVEAVISEDTTSSILMTTAKEELDESIKIAQDLVNQSQSTSNPAYNIKTTDWTSTTIDGMSMYTYTLTHNLNTTNIIVSSYTSDNTNVDLPFKIINNNSIQFMVFTKEAYKVIISANYQAVSGTLASGIATEVQDARGEYGTLDGRLDNIDTAITTTKTELEQLIEDTALATKKALYPTNSIYLSLSSTNPNTLFGFGTWELIGQGRTLVGVDTTDTDFNTPGKTGGNKTHAHDSGSLVADIGAIGNDTASIAYNAVNPTKTKYNLGITGSGISGIDSKNANHATSVSGNTGNVSSLQPYVTAYIWIRKA